MIATAPRRLQQEDQRQGQLPFAQIAPEGFADFLLVADQIQTIVIDLVRRPELQPELLERPDPLRRRLAQKRPQLRRRREQRPRLHLDDFIVIRHRQLQIETPLRLDDFPRANFRRRIGNAPHDFGFGKIRGQPHGMGEQRIAEENADRIAPLGIDRRTLPAQVGAIHDVVMHQRRDMDQFDDHGQINVTGGDFSRGPAGQQGQGRTQPLARRSAHVVHVTFHRRIESPRLGPDALLHAVEMRIDQLERLLEPRQGGGIDRDISGLGRIHDKGFTRGRRFQMRGPPQRTFLCRMARKIPSGRATARPMSKATFHPGTTRALSATTADKAE